MVVTPATQWGSWSWLEEVIERAPRGARWTVISYGRPRNQPANVTFIALPALNYLKHGRLMSRRPYLILNLFYFLPLAVIVWVVGTWLRPTVLVGNGLVASAILAPLKLFGGRLCLAFHGYTAYMGKAWTWILQRFSRVCDVAFVNSRTSFDDLARFMEPRKVVLVPHWAEEPFFNVPLERPTKDRLVILFVGRLDDEKFAQCLRVSRVLAAEGCADLWAVGVGPLQEELSHTEGLHWLGYIDDRAALAAIYGAADIVWAPADTTYLSRPGAEGLAAGCPIVVSDVPAVQPRAEAGLRVPRDLVPDEIGHVVDGEDDREVVTLLRGYVRMGIRLDKRKACRAYAARHHGPSNLRLVIEVLFPPHNSDIANLSVPAKPPRQASNPLD